MINDTRNLQLTDIRVSKKHEITPGVYVIALDWKPPFTPGQVIGITTDPTIPPRLFSICSGSSDQHIEVLFNIKHDGQLSPLLAKTQPGDTLLVSKPFGTFIDQGQPAWWIAAGTGIAPFRAMLRSGIGSHNTLIHGARKPKHFYFANEIESALRDNYIRCCSQQDGSGLFRGRLTQWLRQQSSLPSETEYLICGSAEMVVEVRDILIGKGITIDNVRSEIYF